MNTIIQSRDRDLGGFDVRRILPAIGRKMVGPFLFLDQMGPANFAPGEGIDVRPHPHISLATVSYLFEGAIHHRDSLGSDQIIQPGDINWMTAGRGIVHSERTPIARRKSGGRMDGIQCWVALPREREETEPTFFHHPSDTLPTLEVDDATIRILVGNAYGHTSPVHSFSDIVYLDVQMPANGRLIVPAEVRELGAYAAVGSIRVNEQRVAQYSLAVGDVGEDLTIETDAPARVMIIGGAPFGEHREIWWNFVSSSNERIEIAKADWAAGRFPRIPGDDQEFIPLPD